MHKPNLGRRWEREKNTGITDMGSVFHITRDSVDNPPPRVSSSCIDRNYGIGGRQYTYPTVPPVDAVDVFTDSITHNIREITLRKEMKNVE